MTPKALILIACYFGKRIREYKSIKSGLLYAHFRKIEVHPKLKYYNDNIHRISSPSDRFQIALFFVFVIAIYGITPITIISAWLIGWGQSMTASHNWQVNINRGCGLPDYDPHETHLTEWIVFGKSFNVPGLKYFTGKRSKWLTPIGWAMILIGLYLL